MENRNLKNKLVAGAAIVALSGFVPTPFNAAHAAVSDSDSLNINATVLTALTVSANASLVFGGFVPIANTGYVDIAATGGASQSNAKLVTGTPAAGGIKFGGSTASNYVIAATGLGTAGFALETASSASDLVIKQLYFGTNANGLATGFTLSAGTLASAKTAQVQLQGNATAVNGVGGRVHWTGGMPALGQYSGSIAITIERP